MTFPPVAWITPTTAGRSSRHAGLWSSFASQDYTSSTGAPIALFVLDDAPTPSPFFSRIRDPRLVYIHAPASPRTPRRTIGAKRNTLIELAANAGIIVHADDDDFYAPDYTRAMIARLVSSNASLARLNVINLLREQDGSRWRWDARQCGGKQCALSGPDVECREAPCDPTFAELARLGWGFSFVYPRAVALAHPFPDVDAGEDHAFARAIEKAGGAILQVDDLADHAWHVVHPSSTSQAVATERLDAPTPPVTSTPLPAPSTRTALPASLDLAPNTPYQTTALVKNTHALPQLLRRALSLGLSLTEVQDPAPCVLAVPDGYRFVRATVTARSAITLPTKLPAPLSWFDRTHVVSVVTVGASGASGSDQTRVVAVASSSDAAIVQSGAGTVGEKTDWPTVGLAGAALAGVVGAFWMVLHSMDRAK